MQRVVIDSFGRPEEVVRLIDFEPVAPAAGQVAVTVKACPINPADFLLITGQHSIRPPLPSVVGVEGIGFIESLGPGVEDLSIGDLVLLPPLGTWSQQYICAAAGVTTLPPEIDILQGAMLGVNPISAACLLSEFQNLQAGDWVIQNAANSAVGRLIVRLAKARGIRTINIVRRSSLISELQAFGADIVLVDGDELPRQVASATESGQIRLALDAIAGNASGRLVNCLAPGGTLVVYGLLSGQPIQVPTVRIVFEGITVTGFSRVRALQQMGRDKARALYQELAQLVIQGQICTEIEAVYSLNEVREAMKHAGQEGRSGKILLTLN